MNKLLSHRASLQFIFFLAACIFFSDASAGQSAGAHLVVNDSSYFESPGLNILVFSNQYGLFNDEKLSGIEIIHHGVRTATNGDVRLEPTPEQWDSIPQVVKRTVDQKNNTIEVVLRYPFYQFEYSIRAESRDNGIVLSVHLTHALPKGLEGRAGFNLEFLPSAYFEKTFMMDGRIGVFPRYPSGAMESTGYGTIESKPIASGTSLILAPEDPERRIAIIASKGELSWYDGRNKAQNGWYVVRTVIPSGQTGNVVEWVLAAHTIPAWTRPPMIAYSQVGYAPNQNKIAVIEFDKNDTPKTTVRLLRVGEEGTFAEAYRVWHGAAHLDDARQAPPDHVHFDLYVQGPKTDSPYKPGEHIPGLNIGGWFDAGDFDIRTQTHDAVVSTLVQLWETFHVDRDETAIDQKSRHVDLHHPDGKPDVLQQIEHGCLQLIAQHRAFGRAINGIVEAHLLQYRHLGDASTATDNLVYDPTLAPSQSDGSSSGRDDDRWAGSGAVIGSAITNYVLYKTFPKIIDPEYTFRCLNYIYGCHPGSNISLVSGVGTVSKKIAYGNNRADFTFIAGGVVPGVLIVKPDFPENKDDWPFLWAENEYVINVASSYLYLVNAVNELSHSDIVHAGAHE